MGLKEEAPERFSLLTTNRQETRNQWQFLRDLFDYEGQVPRVIGMRQLASVGLTIPEPYFVLDDGAFREFRKNQNHLTSSLVDELRQAYQIIREADPDRLPYIGRAFFVPGVEEPAGKRTAGIENPEIFVQTVADFYQDAIKREYDQPGAKIALVFHPFINAAKYSLSKDPVLLVPYAGGDVTPFAGGLKIRSTFGPDEAVQGDPCDVYAVRKDPLGIHVSIQVGQKTETRDPRTSDYTTLEIPRDFQNRQVLTDGQVLAIAADYQKVNERFGPHRLEFITQPSDRGTIIYFRECLPFAVSEESLVQLNQREVRARVVRVESEEAIGRITKESSVVFLPADLFKFRRTDIFAQLAAAAHRERINLTVISHGDIATSHMVRIFTDLGHSVKFIGDEELEDGITVRVFRENGRLKWQRVETIEEMVTPLQSDHLTLKEAGPKAFNLHLLEKAGFLVPNGLSLSTSLFKEYLQSLALTQAVKDLAHLEGKGLAEALRKIHLRITEGKLPKEKDKIWKKEQSFIWKMAQQLPGHAICIRSSANIEDREVAYAGIFDSIIGIQKREKEIITAIQRCWASVFMDKSVIYARTLGVEDVSAIAMGVLIQPLVDGKSGVIFTKDRDTGQFSITVSSDEPGAVVDGRAQNRQQITFDRETGKIIDYIVKTKTGKPILNLDEVEKLVETGFSVEDLFGQPQDIEWVIEKETGKLYLLQSRPIPII